MRAIRSRYSSWAAHAPLCAALASTLLGACLGSHNAVTAQRATASAATAFLSVPIGLCEDYPPESTSFDQVRRDFSLLRSLGVKQLRVSFGWDDLEPEDDQFDWKFTDEFVRIATQEFGLTLLPYVCYTPEWCAAIPGDDGWRSPPRDNDEFGEFMVRLVARYKNVIHTWEIWNEPDNKDYWRGTHEQYANLLRAGANAVRKADPQSQVVFGGISWDLDFIRDLFQAYDAERDVDIVNLHSYAETWTGESIESIANYLDEAAEITRDLGEGEPLWMAEMGYSSHRRGKHVSQSHQAAFAYEHTPRFQAVALLRMIATTLASPNVRFIAWYELRDAGQSGEVIGDDNNRHLGLLDADAYAKPALAALQTARELFSRPWRCIDDRVQTNADNSHVQRHVFERDDGSVLLIAWLATVFDGRPSEENGRAADQRRVRLSVSMPIGRLRLSRAVDELGHATSFDCNIENRTNRTILHDLPLKGGEITILEFVPVSEADNANPA